jgi:hypothetical protein
MVSVLVSNAVDRGFEPDHSNLLIPTERQDSTVKNNNELMLEYVYL